LLPIAFAVDGIGFEPEPGAFRRLTDDGPWRSIRFAATAISGAGGRRTLHVTADPQSSTLLVPDPAFGDLHRKPQFVTVERQIDVSTRPLQGALRDLGVARVDFLKLDVEGLELEILQFSPGVVKEALAIKAEISFAAVRRSQPLARDVEAFLAAQDFCLMDLVKPASWRRHGHVVHPHVTRQLIPYSRGVLVHGDYLFFRSPETIAEPERALRSAFLGMAYGFFDHAEHLLTRPEVQARIEGEYGFPIAAALREASLKFGRRAALVALWRQARGLFPFARTLLNAFVARTR
jgi:FkbM family methyltransferase